MFLRERGCHFCLKTATFPEACFNQPVSVLDCYVASIFFLLLVCHLSISCLTARAGVTNVKSRIVSGFLLFLTLVRISLIFYLKY